MSQRGVSPDDPILDLDTMYPAVALVVYDTLANGNEKYVEIAKFKQTGNGYELLPGRPLSKRSAKNIAETLSIGSQEFLRPKPGTITPKNILSYWGTESEPSITWYVKAHSRRAWFSKSTGIKGKVLPYPCLIFDVKNRELFVGACLDEDPTPESTLYPLPQPNIYESCEVCIGDAEIENSPLLQDLVKSYERAFFDTEFNVYHGIEEKFPTVSLVAFWNKCISSGAFDTSIFQALPTKQTIKLKSLIE